jgi:nucleoside-diphosphate-sugar epimerase
MIVVLTGATGFLGSRVRRDLLAAGLRVRAVVREPSRLTGRGHPRLETYRGDLTVPGALAKALVGAEVLVHCAGASGPAGTSPVEATEAAMLDVVTAAAGAVKRIVVVNSALMLGPTDGYGAATERTRTSSADYVLAEQRRKAALRAATRAARGRGASIEIVYPAPLVGPEGPAPRGFVAAALEGARIGTPPFLPRRDDRRISLAHVDDVAAALVAIVRRGAPDAEYVLAGEAAPFSVLLHEAAAKARRASDCVVRTACSLDSFRRAFCGEVARPAREIAEFLLHEWVFDGSGAERRLDVRFRPFVDAFAPSASGG